MTKFSPKLRRLLAMAIACFLLITAVGPIAALAENISGHWAASDINFLQGKGIVQGDANGNINPDKPITRAEFISIINRAFSFTEKGTANFPDVKANAWYYDDLAIAKKEGYILGDNSGNANPNKPITRAEVSVILSRVLDLKPEADTSAFADSAAFPDWSVDSIIAMFENELIGGYPDNTFRANNNITRAEAFTILARIIKKGLIPETEGAADEEPLKTPPAPADKKNNGGSSGGNNVNISLTVSTAFPNETNESAVEIRYIADPSIVSGVSADITEVSYTINNDFTEYLYLRGDHVVSPKGTLGTGTVMLLPGENTIVFTAKDSNGQMATYTLSNKPVYDEGNGSGDLDEDDFGEAEDGVNLYVKRRLVIMADDGITEAQVAEAVDTIGGEISGAIYAIDLYYIRVDEETEADLLALCDHLMETYPELFIFVIVEYITPMDTESATTDPWWDSDHQWGLDAINVPDAWTLNNYMRTIKVGVLDNGFDNAHEDLSVPAANISNRNAADHEHGTHVMGTIAAIHDNSKGLAGVINTNRNNIYGYDCFTTASGASTTEIIAGMTWLVQRGVKVFNTSLGNTSASAQSDPVITNGMQKLINKGYDFLVVQSAGNGNAGTPISALNSGSFRSANSTLWPRIVVVGATNAEGNLASFSNYGARVDVVAPGVSIYSTLPGNTYANWDGTSMAAPHVTGLAAMTWSVNPGLTAEQVKTLLVDTAESNGLSVVDERSNVNPANHRTYHQVNAYQAVRNAIVEPPAMQGVGNVVGRVTAAVGGAAIQGASIRLVRERDYLNIVRSTVTDNDGYYSILDLTPGLYSALISADGYLPEIMELMVEEGRTVTLYELRAVPAGGTADGTVSGHITNAVTGQLATDEITLIFIRGALLPPFTSTLTTTTDDGAYSIELPPGNYTVLARAEGYIDSVFNVVSVSGQTLSGQNGSITPVLAADQVRVVLTWGELPRDLDSHMFGPAPDGERFWTYYSTQECYYNGELLVALDVDDVSSYGPETTTIYTPVNGIYEFFVHDYSNGGNGTSLALVNSQAKVEVYVGNALVDTYRVPISNTHARQWHVCNIQILDGTITIIPVDTLHNYANTENWSYPQSLIDPPPHHYYYYDRESENDGDSEEAPAA